MRTEVIKIDSTVSPDVALAQACSVLTGGGLVAFPTETVYGVGACVSAPGAIDRLREIKQRPADKAFTVHIGVRETAAEFVPELTALAHRFVRKAWPGPLTLILPVEEPRLAPIMARLNAMAASAMYYDGAVGLRCPDNAVARSLLTSVEYPVVAASANRIGNIPPATPEEVLNELGGSIDMLIDTGRTRYAKPSTIVRLKDHSYEVEREGVYDARTVKRLSTLRLLFVCTGNTCRSPMAAGFASALLARRLGCKIAELEENGVVVDSAGTAGGLGGASEHAVSVMRRRNIDISAHVSSALTVDQLQQADHVFAMTERHRERIGEMLPSAMDRVTLLLEDRDVQDPVGGSEEQYEACARTIEEGVRTRLKEECP